MRLIARIAVAVAATALLAGIAAAPASAAPVQSATCGPWEIRGPWCQ
ncbi:hypothetical protein [Actinoplanes utahensis]|nr:hypothetical protein [Actinoplanes utahensis]